MTSPRLEAMAKRAALPISVQYYPPIFPPSAWPEQWVIRRDGALVDFAYDGPEATRAYFDLVSTLESAAPSSADTAAADPASFSPEDAL